MWKTNTLHVAFCHSSQHFQQELGPHKTCGGQGNSALISVSYSVSSLLQSRTVMCSTSNSSRLFHAFDFRATELSSFNSRWANAQHTALCGLTAVLFSDPVQRSGKRNRSKRLRLQVDLSGENLCSDVLSRKTNEAGSQLHVMASNPEISRLTLPVQTLHNPCSCVCWGNVHPVPFPPFSWAPQPFSLLTHDPSAPFNLFTLPSQLGAQLFAWMLSYPHCIEKSLAAENSRMSKGYTKPEWNIK